MSQGPRHINTDRSLNRPTEQRPTEASALHQVSLSGQPDFFQNEQPAPQQPEPPRQSAGGGRGGNGGSRPPRHAAPADAPRRRKKKKKTPVWLPMAVTLAVLAVISGVVVYAVNMMNKVGENLKPEENATSLVEEILTDMILYCQFDIKGGALRMLQIPRNSLVATQNRKITLSNGKTYAATNYQINSVALSNGGDIAALAEVIYDQYKLPIDYYVTIDMQALVEMVDNFGGIEVYIPHDMSFAGSVLKQGYRNLDGASAEFFVRCRHGEGYANSDIDRLNMQRYFYAGLFKRVRSMGVTDVIAQLPLIFNNYIHTDMDLTTIAKMLVSFTRIDSANIMLAQTPVFMGVPNVGKTSSFDGYSCVVPDAGSIAELLNTYFRNYTGPVSAEEMNLVTNNWPHGTASTSANVQFVGQLDKESDDAILSGDTDVAGATTTDGQAAGQ